MARVRDRRVIVKWPDEGPPQDRRDELALVYEEAAVAAASATIAAMFGPAGAVAAAFLGPFAVHAGRRFRELRARVDGAGLDDETIIGRLEENEALAHLVAEVVRGTVESDLAAKRALLARAAIRALQDDAVVDVEARFVRTAVEIDSADVRVLAIVGQRKSTDEKPKRPEGTQYVDEIMKRWPGGSEIVGASLASLTSAGLIEDPGPGALRHGPQARITGYGREFLNRLLDEGLEDELVARDSAGE
jgi:hypothetical protein